MDDDGAELQGAGLDTIVTEFDTCVHLELTAFPSKVTRIP
jgi:hypothetical protein